MIYFSVFIRYHFREITKMIIHIDLQGLAWFQGLLQSSPIWHSHVSFSAWIPFFFLCDIISVIPFLFCFFRFRKTISACSVGHTPPPQILTISLILKKTSRGCMKTEPCLCRCKGGVVVMNCCKKGAYLNKMWFWAIFYLFLFGDLENLLYFCADFRTKWNQRCVR